jgi:hypothetical protein
VNTDWDQGDLIRESEPVQALLAVPPNQVDPTWGSFERDGNNAETTQQRRIALIRDVWREIRSEENGRRGRYARLACRNPTVWEPRGNSESSKGSSSSISVPVTLTIKGPGAEGILLGRWMDAVPDG